MRVFLASLLAFAGAAFLFSANLQSDDDGILAGLVLIFGAVLGLIFRKVGVGLSPVLGLSIVASELWNFRFGTARPQMTSASSFLLLGCAMVAIALLGSCSGWALRRLISRPSEAPSRKA